MALMPDDTGEPPRPRNDCELLGEIFALRLGKGGTNAG
jgi:hypothetical protein